MPCLNENTSSRMDAIENWWWGPDGRCRQVYNRPLMPSVDTHKTFWDYWIVVCRCDITHECHVYRYAQHNCIWDLSGLEGLLNLDTLNVSNNDLDAISHIDSCPMLHTLLLANNRLESLDSIAVLANCKAVSTLDLQGNKLEDPKVQRPGKLPAFNLTHFLTYAWLSKQGTKLWLYCRLYQQWCCNQEWIL